VANSGTVRTLTNSGTISGGGGGFSYTIGGAGGAGVSNSGTITTLTNSGTINGGGGGGASNGGAGGVGGAGVANSGTIATLTNSGTILSGPGGGGGSAGAPGDAIYSAGPNASIGPITNSGKIIGDVEIDNQKRVSITGGSGKTFGSWTGGTITIGSGNLIFAHGNTALGDNIVVKGGAGTVFNDDPLMIDAPQTITGNFGQSAVGALDFGIAGDMTGQYGALAITGFARLDGDLGLELTNGFKLAAGDVFDFLTYGGFSGGFSGVSVDGAACSAVAGDVWACGIGFNLDVALGVDGLDLTVARIPEPATWAMLAVGFLGLGGLRLIGRTR
jgi:hypothetical protein